MIKFKTSDEGIESTEVQYLYKNDPFFITQKQIDGQTNFVSFNRAMANELQFYLQQYFDLTK